MTEKKKNNQTDQKDFSEKQKIVGIINEREITRGQLDFQVNQISMIQQIPAPDKSTEEGKKFDQQVLNQMFNNFLLMKEAIDQGVKATKEEIDKQYSAIINQVGSEDNLIQALDKIGITKDFLKEDIERQFITEKYIDSLKIKHNIQVADEEIKKFYDEQVVPQNANLEFEKVKPQIRQRIELQKLGQILTETLQNLRKDAKIKISL